MNTRSLAIETSPAAVNEWGRADSIVDSETLKKLVEPSVILKRFPVLFTFVLILILTRSPDRVWALPGELSINSPPPEVNPSKVICTPMPEVIVSALTSRIFPEVIPLDAPVRVNRVSAASVEPSKVK